MSGSWRDTIQDAPSEPEQSKSWRDTIVDNGQEISKGTSALRGAEQGALMGWADEIQGAVEAGGQALGVKGLGENDFDHVELMSPNGLSLELMKKAYENRRNRAREEYANAKEANPKMYLAGEFGGGAATGLLLPAGQAATLGKAVKTGASLGAVGGLGNSEKDDLGGMVGDTAKGAAIGGTIGAAAHGVGKILDGSASKGFKDFAEDRAFAALGGVKKHADAAAAKGQTNRIGRMLLDEDIVTPLASKTDIAEKLAERSGNFADEMSALTKKIDAGEGLDDVQKFVLKQNAVNPSKVAEVIKARIRAENDMLPEAAIQSKLDAVDKLVGGDKFLSMAEANRLKQQISRGIKENSYWKENPSGMQDLAVKTRRAVKEAIEHHGDQYANVSHGEAGKVKALNQLWGDTLEAENIVGDRLTRDMANQKLSLSDTVVGAGGVASGGPYSLLKGATLAAANFVRRNYGDNMAARSADAISKLLRTSKPFADIAQKNPEAFNAIVNSTTQVLGAGSGAGGYRVSGESRPNHTAQYKKEH